MTMGVITLLALVLAIFIGFKRKVNTGLVSIFFAFVLGVYVVGMPVREIIEGFPTSLFITLMGMTFLFAIAKVNGTLNIFAETISNLSKNNMKLLPIFFFFISALISAVGPGPIVVTALMAPIALSIADKEEIPPILMACMIIAGSLAGGLSPLSPSGIIANNLAIEIGVTNYTPIFLCVMTISALQGVIFYLFFGGLKIKGEASEDTVEKVAEFSYEQKISIAVILIVVLGILFFKTDIGLTAFAGGVVLLLIYPSRQKESISNISWDILLLISGVSILIKVITSAGGIDTLIVFLSSIMTPEITTAIMAIIAGLMTIVASASGVVMPTLIPTSLGIAQNMGTVPVAAIIAAIVVGSHAATYSPFSPLGALALSAAGEKADKDKLFIQLITLGVFNVLFAAVLGLIGFYNFVS